MPKPEITIVGNVGRDPKPNITNAGTPIATFPVAENHWRWDGRSRKWERIGTSWFRVTCRWGLSEHVAKSLKVGQPVIVVGRLRISEWFDGNGVKQVTADVDAVSVGHDLRRGTSVFSKIEPGKTMAPRGDEQDEINGMHDAPPDEPPDPFESASDSADSEPPADPPANGDEGGDETLEEPPGYDEPFAGGEPAFG